MNLKTLALIASLALAGCGGLSPRDGAASLSPPLLAQRQNERGLVLAASGRYGEAASQFQAAIALEPRAAYLHNNLGFAHLQRGALEQAVAEFEEATRLDPAHPQAVVNLANARAALERRQAVAAQPRTPPVAPKAPNQDTAALKEQARPDLRLIELAPHVYELAAIAPSRPVSAMPVASRPAAQPLAAVPPRRSYRLEVSNGNGVRGMAHRVALQLAADGLRGARTTNDRPFNKTVTEVQYRPGFEQEAARLAALLPGGARLVAGRKLPGRVDVRVVLGADRRPALVAQL